MFVQRAKCRGNRVEPRWRVKDVLVVGQVQDDPSSRQGGEWMWGGGGRWGYGEKGKIAQVCDLGWRNKFGNQEQKDSRIANMSQVQENTGWAVRAYTPSGGEIRTIV